MIDLLCNQAGIQIRNDSNATDGCWKILKEDIYCNICFILRTINSLLDIVMELERLASFWIDAQMENSSATQNIFSTEFHKLRTLSVRDALREKRYYVGKFPSGGERPLVVLTFAISPSPPRALDSMFGSTQSELQIIKISHWHSRKKRDSPKHSQL